VAADGGQVVGDVAVVDVDDLLGDDRALVEVGGDVVDCGGADELDAAVECPGGRAWRP
jgi:hypothetical protein